MKQLALLQCRTPVIKEVRGAGLLVAIDLTIGAIEVMKAAHKRGLLMSRTSEQTVRMTPPLNISQKEIDQAVSILRDVAEGKDHASVISSEARNLKGSTTVR
jgi:acetylornithine/succinyldiaminopimelate/putrescine aminotransferase